MAYLCLMLLSYSLADRNPKFSIFQIIKFENTACTADNDGRYGTCFTESECDANGGTSDGSCADGFGVCCIKMVDDGGTSSMNNSFIVAVAADVTAGSSRTYTMCPIDSSICRIRFWFTGFTLAGPVTYLGTVAAAADDVSVAGAEGAAVGDCTEDTFSITSPTSMSPPVICGTNTGQHMFVDSDGVGCSTVNFGIGSGATARSWDIQVTQYTCGDEMGGPAGCLQWFTANTGTIRSFNFPALAAAADVPLTVVHLSSQHYKACIRRPLTANRICYLPCTNTAAIQHSFGVSISPLAANQNSGIDGQCASDYIGIVGGDTAANAAAGTLSTQSRFCGRALRPNFVANNGEAWANDNASVCTASVPFEVTVHFDEDEVWTGAGDANTSEWAMQPGGIMGFSLCYAAA